MRTVLFDNEAVQALSDPRHRKHRAALAVIEAANSRDLRRTRTLRLVVPTAVRVEAGWDRQAPTAAIINRLRITDSALDRAAADRAASLRLRLGVSVADAHLGSVLAVTPGPVTVVTSDRGDARRIADQLEVSVTIVQL